MSEIIKVMVNGLPGKMASLLAKHILEDSRFQLIPCSLTGPDIAVNECPVGIKKIALIRPDQKEMIAGIKMGYGGFISVDFTHPSAVNANAQFYCDNGLPFVMGTTGGDRELLEGTVTASEIAAMVAPNMAKPVVGIQAMMAYAAKTFPELFMGYSLAIRESHQAKKADTSGTAKAMVRYFNQMGVAFDESQITMERNPNAQKIYLGVPEEYLDGHGWHTYTLFSPDGTVKLEFVHNINGRNVYVAGTLDAVLFLAKKVKEGIKGKMFTMMDVLKG